MKEVYRTQLAGFDIVLRKDRADFEVQYGQQITGGLSYMQAGHELGLSVMHALQCEGKLD